MRQFLLVVVSSAQLFSWMLYVLHVKNCRLENNVSLLKIGQENMLTQDNGFFSTGQYLTHRDVLFVCFIA